MDIMNRITYTGCWVILFLYTVSTLIAFARQSRTACTASFIFANLLWLDLSLFNVWVLIPALFFHLDELNIQGDNTIGLIRDVLASEAARDVYLIILGLFGSTLALFNATSMMITNNRKALRSKKSKEHIKPFVHPVYRAFSLADIERADATYTPLDNHEDTFYQEKGSFSFDPKNSP
ncbi:hypothetical protein F5Y08DRAFT_12264 [Xylaria arbuscula]|uniref:Uncharacterized protein n=1 Tax=Xylaria arbuscula TaxID=114810 RepID=A0A9W8N3W4_9PEZI|nr:hypothetical protein F5Y08DRAFT_12264 [Xylaria arbuscula]KAJ3553572.1 hypothetical protein NPX13_g10859 [Xylaria arbuscula]